MVTKLEHNSFCVLLGSVLAKIHMVTKLFGIIAFSVSRSVLAKIHMVTKPCELTRRADSRSVLAKIHMVTKLKFLALL